MERGGYVKHVDLFSGIGGFALAARWTGFETVVFCENDEFCQKVLKKHWPRVPIIPDIRDFDGTRWQRATLLTGGFPCQPFSVAGRRGGKEDDRYLWPEMFRVIKEAKPTWIIAENVVGIVKLALGEVLFDLESIGYDFPRDTEGTPIVPVIPACGLNAPHRRYRVWIIAYNAKLPRRERCSERSKAKPLQNGTENGLSQQTNSDASNSKGFGIQGMRSEGEQESETHGSKGISVGKNSGTPSDSEGPECNQYGKEGGWWGRSSNGNWEIPWIEVATSFCRVDDGLPSWVYSDRVKRLKALGNAIVPQVAEVIMREIAEVK